MMRRGCQYPMVVELVVRGSSSGRFQPSTSSFDHHNSTTNCFPSTTYRVSVIYFITLFHHSITTTQHIRAELKEQCTMTMTTIVTIIIERLKKKIGVNPQNLGRGRKMPLFQVPFKPIKPQDYKTVGEYQARAKRSLDLGQSRLSTGTRELSENTTDGDL